MCQSAQNLKNKMTIRKILYCFRDLVNAKFLVRVAAINYKTHIHLSKHGSVCWMISRDQRQGGAGPAFVVNKTSCN